MRLRKHSRQREQQEAECVWWQCSDPHLSHTSKATPPVKSREAVKTNKLKTTEPPNLP